MSDTSETRPPEDLVDDERDLEDANALVRERGARNNRIAILRQELDELQAMEETEDAVITGRPTLGGARGTPRPIRGRGPRLVDQVVSLQGSERGSIAGSPNDDDDDDEGRADSKGEEAIARQARKLRVSNMHKNLPKYGGEADVSKLDNFINLHTKYLNASCTRGAALVCEHIGFYLTGVAGQWFRRAEENNELGEVTSVELFALLKAQFLGASQKEDIRAKLKKIQFTGSTINYNSSFRRLVDDARLAGGADPIPASDVLRYYYDGLERGGTNGQKIAMCLMFQRAANNAMHLEEMMSVADFLANEMGIVNKRARDDPNDAENKPAKKIAVNNANAAKKGGNGHGGSNSTRGRRGRGGSFGSAHGSPRTDAGSDAVRCYNCNQLGHISPNCPDKGRRKGHPEVNATEVASKPRPGFR